MSTIQTDLLVIGGGPGGYTAAFLAADLGLRVVLIDEHQQLGGTCLREGCIPSKALLQATHLLADAKAADVMGIEFLTPKIDFKKLIGWKQSIIDDLARGLTQLTKQRQITFYQGQARFLSSTKAAIATAEDEQQVDFRHAILATGTQPVIPPALNIDDSRIWTSRQALAPNNLPSTLLVIGGGYIGLELGTVYAGLGSQVTLVEAQAQLLPQVDQDLRRVLQTSMKEQLHTLHLATTVERLQPTQAGIVVELNQQNNKQMVTVDAVLVAIGRQPRLNEVGLAYTKVTRDAQGYVVVDAKRRTTDPNIYAVGDITGGPMLAHKAAHEGRVAVEAILGKTATYQPQAVPAIIYTQPELAYCGLTEQQAKAAKIEVDVVRFPWAASGRAKTQLDQTGLTKLIVDPEQKRILGAGVVGKNAGELIQPMVLAIEMGANAQDIASTIHAHPTLSETWLEVAEMVFGTSTSIYRPIKKSS